MTCNRVIPCSAEPPRPAISIRPGRYSHSLVNESGEFIVNIPTPEQFALVDYIGVVTGQKEDKIAIANLELTPALKMKSPLLANCPVNIECIVEHEIALDSHTMFIALVQAIHAEESPLDAHGDVDVKRAGNRL